MRNAFGQLVVVRACIIDGCTDEFLIGVDFMSRHRANLDFERNEVRYFDKETMMVIPFRTAKVAAVRMTRRAMLASSTVTSIEVAARMMNGVLRGLTWLTCLVYLDDIVVYTKGGVERHILELATVLERLSAAGLTLKLKKCVFAAKVMEYLGHELSSNGVRPAAWLVTAVSEFPRSTYPIEVKRFVHLAGYYRKFIETFGSIMQPMTRLLKQDDEWEWTEAQEFAFERVKAALTTMPLLVYPDFTLPFCLVTDASKVGLGACLMQDQGRGW
ncbi:hypothetical protein PC110_g20013 [Phytophthora cactorum]|uniref:Reverse transcriptase domain-containing protein n=1 Tax=Phytophthora cactorum TaxID=29920 RepID=A0A329RFR1_9STRA|nr:hypothetical protein PC110_g20013 [Phytophthora cactorum]